MTNQIIFEFVNIFFPEHKPFWENLKEEEKAFLNSIPYNEDKLKKVIFNPEENSKEVEKFRNKMKDLEMILSHRECVFDFFLFKKLSHFYGAYFDSKYDFIFAETEKYSAQIKETKTIKSQMKKIYAFIPRVYEEYEKNKFFRGSEVFGRFYQHIDSVTFSSNFEKVTFKREEINLIPYFIEYRNSHLIDWIVESFLENTKRKQGHNSVPYEFYSLTSKLYSVEWALKKNVETLVRTVLSKHHYYDVEIETKNNCCQIRYSAKNSLFASHCSYKINLFNFEEEVKQFERYIATEV